MPKSKIDIILQMRKCIGKLSDSNNVIEIHLVTGHKNMKRNEIGDKQPKEGDNEVMGTDIKYMYYKITLNKEEVVQE